MIVFIVVFLICVVFILGIGVGVFWVMDYYERRIIGESYWTRFDRKELRRIIAKKKTKTEKS